MVSPLSEPRQALPRSDQLSGQSRSPPLSRSVSKEKKSRSEESSTIESDLTRSSVSRVLEESASMNLNVLKLHRRKMMDGVIQTHLVSSIVGCSATIHSLQRPAIPRLPLPRRQSYLTTAGGEEKLGLPLVGLSFFGPCRFLLWPTLIGNSPNSSHRPRFVKSSNSIMPFVYLYLNIISSSRGLFSRLVLDWIQGLVELYSRAERLGCAVDPLETVSELEFKFEVYYGVQHPYQTLLRFKSPSTPLSKADLSNPLLERGILLIQVVLSYPYIRKSQLPISSSHEERTLLSCPLSLRGEFLPVAKPENLFNALTALFSSVMAHLVPVETTVIISLRTEVKVSSKSYGKMTIKLVDEFVLKSGSFTYVLEMFNSSPNVVLNWVKFVSLSIAYEYLYVVAGWPLYWICPS